MPPARQCSNGSPNTVCTLCATPELEPAGAIEIEFAAGVASVDAVTLKGSGRSDPGVRQTSAPVDMLKVSARTPVLYPADRV